MKITRHHLQKLLSSGWQSWSTGYDKRKIGRTPIFLHPPRPISINSSMVGMRIPMLKNPIKGWCSYYAFGTNINETKILDQIEVFKKNNLTKFEYILLDEGWNTAWGDWLQYDKHKFPSGLKRFTNKIKTLGFKPGIWLAPLLVSPHAQIVASHPDWFVQKNSTFVEGLQMTQFDRYLPFQKYMLDIQNKKVQKYLDQVLSFLLRDCGFELIKLDFLYANHFAPNRTTKDADMDLNAFLLRIKKKYPNVYTLGCGCPMIPAIGAVDGMRIGPDTLTTYVQRIPWFGKYTNQRRFKNVMKNLTTRRWTSIFWNTDPDVFMCQNTYGLSHKKLIDFQQHILKLKGNIFLGDDMTKLSEEKIRTYIKPFIK